MGEETIAELLGDKWKRTIAERIGIADKTPGEAALMVTERSLIRTKGCGRKTTSEIAAAIRSSPEAAEIFDRRSEEDWGRRDLERTLPERLLEARKALISAARSCKNLDALREAARVLNEATASPSPA